MEITVLGTPLWYWNGALVLNIWQPRHDGWQITDDICTLIFQNEKDLIWFNFHWSLFPMVQFMISQHWIRLCLGVIKCHQWHLKMVDIKANDWYQIAWRYFFLPCHYIFQKTPQNKNILKIVKVIHSRTSVNTHMYGYSIIPIRSARC